MWCARNMVAIISKEETACALCVCVTVHLNMPHYMHMCISVRAKHLESPRRSFSLGMSECTSVRVSEPPRHTHRQLKVNCTWSTSTSVTILIDTCLPVHLCDASTNSPIYACGVSGIVFEDSLAHNDRLQHRFWRRCERVTFV